MALDKLKLIHQQAQKATAEPKSETEPQAVQKTQPAEKRARKTTVPNGSAWAWLFEKTFPVDEINVAVDRTVLAKTKKLAKRNRSFIKYIANNAFGYYLDKEDGAQGIDLRKKEIPDCMTVSIDCLLADRISELAIDRGTTVQSITTAFLSDLLNKFEA